MDSPKECGGDTPTSGTVNKRRSLVFQRQSVVPKEQDLESANFSREIGHESKKIKLQDETENKFDHQMYIKMLKDEDDKWREIYARRKSCVQELAKRDKNQEQSLDLTSLSDSERAFLRARPNYEEFKKDVFLLHSMAKKVTFLNLCAQNFCKKSANKLLNEKNNIMHRIIKLSELE